MDQNNENKTTRGAENAQAQQGAGAQGTQQNATPKKGGGKVAKVLWFLGGVIVGGGAVWGGSKLLGKKKSK